MICPICNAPDGTCKDRNACTKALEQMLLAPTPTQTPEELERWLLSQGTSDGKPVCVICGKGNPQMGVYSAKYNGSVHIACYEEATRRPTAKETVDFLNRLR